MIGHLLKRMIKLNYFQNNTTESYNIRSKRYIMLKKISLNFFNSFFILIFVLTFMMFLNSLFAVSNLTENFKKYQKVDQTAMETRFKEELKKYYIFLHPGLFAKLYRVLHTGYFTNFTHCLKGLGFVEKQDFEIYKVNGVTTYEEMSEKLAKRIKQLPKNKKLLLIGHSKGGADLFYLLKKHPELINAPEVTNTTDFPLVESAMLIQSPLKGTPIANTIEETLPLRLFFKALSVSLGDHFATIHEERTDQHFSLYDQYQNNMAFPIPVVTLGTSIPADKIPNFWSLTLPHHIMAKRDDQFAKNDGLVPLKSAIIEDELDYISLDNLDHAQFNLRLPKVYALASSSNTHRNCSVDVYPILAILLDLAQNNFQK